MSKNCWTLCSGIFVLGSDILFWRYAAKLQMVCSEMCRRRCLALFVIVGFLFAGDAQAKPKTISLAQPIIPVTVQQDIARIANALEAANTKQQSAKEKQLDEKKLKDQDNMVGLARRMFWLGVFDSMITVIGVILVGWTLHHTKRAADAAQSALTKLERPHLFIESPQVAPDTRIRLQRNGPTWVGELPFFDVLYNVVNYGRSPAILIERSATAYIGESLPSTPEINPNDIYNDPVVIPANGSRKGWKTFWRAKLTDDIIGRLWLRRSVVGQNDCLRAYLFVRLKYESVAGKVDEIGAIWEYLVDIDAFIPLQDVNYAYRHLGD